MFMPIYISITIIQKQLNKRLIERSLPLFIKHEIHIYIYILPTTRKIVQDVENVKLMIPCKKERGKEKKRRRKERSNKHHHLSVNSFVNHETQIVSRNSRGGWSIAWHGSVHGGQPDRFVVHTLTRLGWRRLDAFPRRPRRAINCLC